MPWPERILSVAVLTQRGEINVHTTHIPPGSTNGWMKIEMLEAVSAVVSEHSNAPSILCGDFNMPQAETPEGRIVTWGETLSTAHHSFGGAGEEAMGAAGTLRNAP